MTKPEDATEAERKQHVHGLGSGGFVRVLEKSEEPILAFVNEPSNRATEEENDRGDRIVLVTGETDYKGRQVVVIDGIDSSAIVGDKRIKTTKTVNSFGQRNLIKMIRSALDNGRLLYVNHKKISPETGGDIVQSDGSRSETYYNENIQKFWDNVKRLHGDAAERQAS